MNKKISKVLTDGLIGGYAGKGQISKVERGIFEGKSSHSEPTPEEIYHDEWFVPNYLGGGQELVKVGENMFTRLYGGGTPTPEKLAVLGVTDTDVCEYLKSKIIELENRTRLFDECKPEPDGDWQYSYEMIIRDPNIPVIVSSESITYKGTRVHLHPFILCPLS